ncbi:hypothetical protein J6590_052176 [Homalodisca vitripennis]|nr:hypothetical protein J6590_052176 [Homalodisca vitripennis]
MASIIQRDLWSKLSGNRQDLLQLKVVQLTKVPSLPATKDPCVGPFPGSSSNHSLHLKNS